MKMATKIKSIWMLLRPYQWIKNFFVVAPLLFSVEFIHLNQCLRSFAAFVCFCLASSTVYIFNDLLDVKEDRNHPQKCNRPIASREITFPQAWVCILLLLAVAILLCLLLGTNFLILVFSYVLLGAVYSLFFKHMPILDVMVLSAFFLIRIFAGCVILDITISSWMILCTIMLALFLGFSKRKAELMSANDTGLSRKVLEEYSQPFLDHIITLLAGSTIICYALYTVDQYTVEKFGTQNLVFTIPFVLYGIFRYLYLVYHLHKGQEPSKLMVTDKGIFFSVLLWAICSGIILLFAKEINSFF